MENASNLSNKQLKLNDFNEQQKNHTYLLSVGHLNREDRNEGI